MVFRLPVGYKATKTALFIQKQNRLLCSEKKVWLDLNGVSVFLNVYS